MAHAPIPIVNWEAGGDPEAQLQDANGHFLGHYAFLGHFDPQELKYSIEDWKHRMSAALEALRRPKLQLEFIEDKLAEEEMKLETYARNRPEFKQLHIAIRLRRKILLQWQDMILKKMSSMHVQ